MQQFLRGVDWGQLDYLLIDLPPGTGDVQLSLVQTVPINGAVVVTTPSEVAMEDARKAVRMFEQVKTPIVGLVENMSYLVGPGGEHIDVFGQGGGRRMAEAMNIPFLVELPLDPKVRIGGDSGAPAALDPLGAGATSWQPRSPTRWPAFRKRPARRSRSKTSSPRRDQLHLLHRGERYQFCADDLADDQFGPAGLRDDPQPGGLQLGQRCLGNIS
jgi:hypothetical protein